MTREQAAEKGWCLAPFPHRTGRFLWIGPGQGSVGPDFTGWASEADALAWLAAFLKGQEAER